MVHICKGNFPTVFSNHCHHVYCGGRAKSTINIVNNCGGGRTNFCDGFVAGLGFGLGNLFGGFGMGNIFGGFGMGMPMFGGMNMWSPWQSFGMDQFQWNNGRNNGSTDVTNKWSKKSDKPGDAKADFIDEDDIKIKGFEDAIIKATTPAEIDNAIKGLKELKLKDNYKNDENTEKNAIANIIAKAETRKAELLAEQAKQQPDPLGDADKSELQKAEITPDGTNTATENTEGVVASTKKNLDTLNGFTLPDGYTKIEDGKFDKEKSVYAHDGGKPADVNPIDNNYTYTETNSAGVPEAIEIVDTKGRYIYEYVGKTEKGYPIYKSMTTDNYYALVEKGGKNVLLQQGEAFRGLGLDKPDGPSVKATTPASKKVEGPERKTSGAKIDNPLSNEEAIKVISEMLPNTGLTNIKLNTKKSSDDKWTFVSKDGGNYKFAYRREPNSNPTDTKIVYRIEIFKDKKSIYQNYISSNSNNDLDKKAIKLIENANVAPTSNNGNIYSSKIELNETAKRILETFEGSSSHKVSFPRTDGHVMIKVSGKEEGICLYRNKKGEVTKVGLLDKITIDAWLLGIGKVIEVCVIPVEDIMKDDNNRWNKVLNMIDKYSGGKIYELH